MSKTWAMVRSLLVHRGENGRISDPPGRRPMGARPHFPPSQRCRTTVHAGGRYCLRPTEHFGSIAGILFAFVVIANSQPRGTPARIGGSAACRDGRFVNSIGIRFALMAIDSVPRASRRRPSRGIGERGLGASGFKGRRESCAVRRIAAAGAKDTLTRLRLRPTRCKQNGSGRA